jgi:D-sedoheptulose 7-phosphate isomerase
MFALQSLQDAQKVLNSFIENKNNVTLINSAISVMVESYKNDGRMFSCGNGGSMCDAMHFGEELTG